MRQHYSNWCPSTSIVVLQSWTGYNATGLSGLLFTGAINYIFFLPLLTHYLPGSGGEWWAVYGQWFATKTAKRPAESTRPGPMCCCWGPAKSLSLFKTGLFRSLGINAQTLVNPIGYQQWFVQTTEWTDMEMLHAFSILHVYSYCSALSFNSVNNTGY